MNFSKQGCGRPLLLLHGLVGGSFCWRYNVAEFAKARTTYAFDMPGMGSCDADRGTDCSMRAQAQRLEAFIESANLRDIDVVGSSWGGGVATLLAAESRRIRSLVLVAPVNPWSAFGRERVRFFAGRFGSALLRCGMPYARKLHYIGVERMYGDLARIRSGTREGYSALLQRRGLAGCVVNILRNWDRDLEALRDAIPRVTAPVLLIWGTHDGAVDPRSAEPLQAAFRQCETAVLPGIGHIPFEEAPEVFNRLVLEFIDHPR